MIEPITTGIISILGAIGIVIGALVSRHILSVLMWYFFFIIIGIVAYEQIQDLVVIVGVNFL